MIRGFAMSREAASCNVIFDKNNVITNWVCDNLGNGNKWLGEHLTIGFTRKDRLIGGLIYHDCRPGHDVWWTLYTNDKHWCTRNVLRFIFSVAFDYLCCRRISILTSVNNKECLKLVSRLGFKQEGLLKEYDDDGSDVVIMALHKQFSKF